MVTQSDLGTDRSSCLRRRSLPILAALSNSGTAAGISPNSCRAHNHSSYSDTCLLRHQTLWVLDSPWLRSYPARFAAKRRVFAHALPVLGRVADSEGRAREPSPPGGKEDAMQARPKTPSNSKRTSLSVFERKGAASRYRHRRASRPLAAHRNHFTAEPVSVAGDSHVPVAPQSPNPP